MRVVCGTAKAADGSIIKKVEVTKETVVTTTTAVAATSASSSASKKDDKKEAPKAVNLYELHGSVNFDIDFSEL